MSTVEIEFDDDSAPQQRKSAPIKKLYDTNTANTSNIPGQNSQNQIFAENKSSSYEYDFEDSGGILLNCKVEDWSRSFSLFMDFLRDAKKYYKKTCLNAKFVYFFSYRPMYRELNHEQLCWYLFWRSRVRDGEYIKTGLSYIFLYIYEQINLSGIINHEKVYENIIKIWKNYRAEFPRMDKYIAEWLIDFALINKIKINLSDIEDIIPGILNLVTIPELYMKDDFFKSKVNAPMIIKSMSVYDYTKSKFYTDKSIELFDYHIEQIVNAVLSSGNFGEIVRKETEDGVKVKATRESFIGAVCVYDYKKKITVEYINLYRNFYIRGCVTDTVRYAENVIRDYLGIKSKLTINSLPENLKRIIEEYKSKYLFIAKPAKITVKTKGKKKDADIEPEPEPIEFNPNLQTAAEIEKSSWDTTLTLVELQTRDTAEPAVLTSFADDESPEEEDDDDGEFIMIDTGDPEDYTAVEEIAPAGAEFSQPKAELEDTGNTEDIFDILENLENTENIENTEDVNENGDMPLTDTGRFIASLTADELRAVEMLITAEVSGKSFDMIGGDFLNQTGAMLEFVIDTVNEKSMDCIGDIIFDTAVCEIIADYRNEIKECLKR